MPSGADLVNEVIDTLRSNNEDQVTTLNNNMLAADLTFNVQAVTGMSQAISPGVVEIDSELIYVTTVAGDGTCTVAPGWGRGYRGTTAATHSQNAMVKSNPAFPRYRVMRAINETINRCFPTLFAVKTTNFTTTIPSITYDLPDDAVWPLNAMWQPVSAAQSWIKVRRWSYNTGHGSADALGVSLDIGDRMQPGRPLVVTYAAQPGNLANEAADFATVTGFDPDAEDLIVVGAAALLAPPLEFSRELISSMEQQERNQLISAAAGLASGSYLEKQFQTRLKEQGRALALKYGPRIVGVF